MKEHAARKQRKQSVTLEVLKALVPYTPQNIKLAFKPNKFFNDLERITHSNRNTLASTYSRAKRQGYIEINDGVPVLTAAGRAKIGKIDKPDLLAGWLVVSFDIPEKRRHDRYELRNHLKSRGFKQIQKSLWCTDYDYTQDLREVIAELGIGPYVLVFIAASVFTPGKLTH